MDNSSNYLTIRRKIIVICVVFTLIVTIIITSLGYYVFDALLYKNFLQSTTDNLHLISETVATDLTFVTSLSDWTTSNTEINAYLRQSLVINDITSKNPQLSNSEDFNNYDSALTKLRQDSLAAWGRMREEYRSNPVSMYIQRVIISSIDLNPSHYLQFASTSTDKAFDIPSLLSSTDAYAFYIDNANSSDVFSWYGLSQDPFSEESSSFIFPLFRPIKSIYSDQVIGWSFIGISSNILTDTLKSYTINNDSQLFITINDRTYIWNGSSLGNIQIEDSQKAIVADGKIHQISTSDQETYSLVTIRSETNGIFFSQSLPKNLYMSQHRLYVGLLLMILFTVVLLGLGLTIFLDWNVNRPIRKLIHHIDQLTLGHFESDPSLELANEFGDIGRCLNHLSSSITDLMKHRLADEQEKSDLKYQILQSQINPHFLYNTLNSIKWMATLQHADGISEMATALSRLLRAVTKDTHPLHSLREEIQLLDNYFLIQNYRYGGMIHLNYHIQKEDLYEIQVPSFTLQPLVENAIFHGIEPKGNTGNIDIFIHQSDQDILIDIQDDGIGISPEKISELLSENSLPNKKDFFKKIGIQNVHRRIRHHYGKDYGVHIQSKLGEGTIMTLRLPLDLHINPQNMTQGGLYV